MFPAVRQSLRPAGPRRRRHPQNQGHRLLPQPWPLSSQFWFRSILAAATPIAAATSTDLRPPQFDDVVAPDCSRYDAGIREMLVDDLVDPHRADLGSLKHRRTLGTMRMFRNAIDGKLLTSLCAILPP